MGVDATALKERLDSLIDRDELKQMLIELVDIHSPTGKEEACARYLGQALR